MRLKKKKPLKKLKTSYCVQIGRVLVVQSERDIDRQSESQWNSPNELLFIEGDIYTQISFGVFSHATRKKSSYLSELRIFRQIRMIFDIEKIKNFHIFSD